MLAWSSVSDSWSTLIWGISHTLTSVCIKACKKSRHKPVWSSWNLSVVRQFTWNKSILYMIAQLSTYRRIMASKDTQETHERQLLGGKHRGSSLPFLDIFLNQYVEVTGNPDDGHPCNDVYRAYRRFVRRLVGKKLRRGKVELPAGVHLLLGKGPREKFSQVCARNRLPWFPLTCRRR